MSATPDPVLAPSCGRPEGAREGRRRFRAFTISLFVATEASLSSDALFQGRLARHERLVNRLHGYITELGTFIQANQVWAGPMVGAVAFGESIFIVGILLPATPLLVIVGALVASGVLDPLPILLCAIVGAVAGDIVCYAIGAALGIRLMHRPALKPYRTSVARARLFFRRYGFAAVFLGRFFGPLRCTLPLVAGMMRMTQRKFQIANVLSAIVWAPAMLAPGYLAARGLARLEADTEAHWPGLIIGSTLLAIVLTMLGARLLRGGNDSERARRRAARVRPSQA
jgi:membrane protein DedA with SNARE-associated domain